MATDLQRLQAERLYVESELPQSDLGIARACGIDRGTVKRWREAGDWERKRAEFQHRCRTDAAIALRSAADAVRQSAKLLDAIEAQEILANIARTSTNPFAQIAAVKEVRAWLEAAAEAERRTEDSGVSIIPADSDAWQAECLKGADDGRA